MAEKIVVEIAEEKKKLPPYTQAYKLILSMLEDTKLKEVRRLLVRLTRLIHLESPMALKDVRIFSEFARYHTKSGKLRKNSYRFLLSKGMLALTALSPKVDKERGARKLKPVNIKKDIKKLDAISEPAMAPKPERIPKEVRIRRKRLVDETKDSDDAMFIKSINKTDVESLGHGEEGFIKRSIVFFNTMVPQTILRKITVEYGIQRVAHYMMASHAKLVGVPIFKEDDVRLTLEQRRKIAEQKVLIRNKIRAKRGEEPIAIFGKEVTTPHHTYWLLLPKSMNDDPSVRIGRWEFSNTPTPKDAQYI